MFGIFLKLQLPATFKAFRMFRNSKKRFQLSFVVLVHLDPGVIDKKAPWCSVILHCMQGSTYYEFPMNMNA